MKNKIISLFLLLMLFSCSDLFDLYQLQNISITFNSNGGTGNMAEQSFTVGVSQKLSANIFTRSGYTFVGWNSSADGSGRSYSNEESLTFSEETSLTLYAQWQKNVTYAKVTFNSNGGTGNMAEQSFTVGVSQKLSANIFTRSGYIFVGWNSSADGSGRSYSNEESLTLNDETPLTLYAQWQKNIAKMEISFASNGGSGNMPVQIFTEGESQNLSANTFTRTGYTFTGWNTQFDGSGTSYTDEQSLTLTEDAPLTLYAQWVNAMEVSEKNVMCTKVIFDSNGGTGSMSNQIFTVGVSKNLQANTFTRTDYTFTSWNTQSDGSGTSYTDEQSLTLTEDAPLTLYAQWQKEEVVSYFLVPNSDKLNLYDDLNRIIKEDLLGESVTLKECFDQVADENGNLYFSYKNEDGVIVAKYAGGNVSEIIEKDGEVSNVRLAYNDSKLYVLLDSTINVVENGKLKMIYETTETINAFIVDNGYIYFAVQNFNENTDEIHKITVVGDNEAIYSSIDCGEHDSFISDMTMVNGSLYLLQVECEDFSSFDTSDYWRGALVKVEGSQTEKFALSSSDFGTETSFYSPLRFFAVRKNELLIMDDGFVTEDWEIKQKNRLAIFKFKNEQIDFSDMTEEMLYNFGGS